MELSVLLPVLVFAMVFSAVVLTYSVQKTVGIFPQSFIKRILSSTSSSSPAEDDDLMEAARGKSGQQLLSELRLSAPISCLQWHDINVRVGRKPEASMRLLLHSNSGIAMAGDMLAIIGPSGAGKSTLLDALAMRSPGDSQTGLITVDGQAVSKSSYRNITTYIPQEDIFIPTLSVWETIEITSKMRLPSNIEQQDRQALIHESLCSMGLHKLKSRQVGGLLPGGLHVRGLSGGEKRRLSIACGVVGAPRILFLDEPTSGLDSNAALVVMECMSKLASQQRIVVSSIHQPGAALWALFNSVHVLSDGQMLYHGPTSQVRAWFSEGLGYAYDPVADGSVPEWLANLVSTSFKQINKEHGATMKTAQDVEAAALAFGTWQGSQPLSKDLSKQATGELPPSGNPRADGDRKYIVSTWRQYAVLQRRANLVYVRNPANVAGRTLMSVTVGVLAGLIFLNAAPGLVGAQRTLSALFVIALVQGLLPFAYMSMFVNDRVFFTLDPTRNLYSTIAYYTSTCLANSVTAALNAAIFMLLMYSLAGLHLTTAAVLYSTGFTCLYSLAATQFLVLSAYVMPNQDLAFVVAISYVTLAAVVGGYLVPITDMAYFLQILSYVSIFRYQFNALVQLQYSGRSDGCGVADDPAYLATAKVRVPRDAALREACDSILENNALHLSLPKCFAGIMVLLVLFHAISYVALIRLRLRKKA